MTKSRFALIAIVSIAIALAMPNSYDFATFYYAGRDVLHGVNPYTDSIGYFNPIIVAWLYAPLSLLRYDVAEHIGMFLFVAVYLMALSRIFKGSTGAIMMLSPFTILIARYNNLEAFVLLGATLPAGVGVWLLLMKPQLGIFAAIILIVKYRAWKTGAACLALLGVSVALGMGRTTPLNARWNFSLFPWSLIVGLPLLWYAWRKRDELTALGASVFVTPYLNIISGCAALPLFRRNWKTLTIGVLISWGVFLMVW